jgi:ParB-like chromosome segregation protein Spo0J
VPLLITSDGRIVDGHERHRTCLELGLHRYPMRVLGGMTEGERRERAIRINAERRHLTRTQRRELLESLIRAEPARSTRDLADLLRVGKSTVSRTRQTILAGVPSGTPEFIEGRDGKVY